MPASSSSSPSGLRFKYDVFINFRGEDTRRGFVSHLYKALRQNPINTFIDAQDLRKGDRLSELLTAIRESRISIVVFSQNYASSPWCLKELVQILECKDTNNQIVLPIFYEVDPSDIRKLKKRFAKAFTQHDRHSNAEMGELRSWRSALTTAAGLSGWDSRKYENDAGLIEEIVEDVSRKLIGLGCKYDVFINFRGEDTRRGFVSHLYNALRQKPINAFICTEKLRKGDHLSELLTAIRESRLSIVVFSQDYASSTWCLKELVQILKCKDANNQIVLPIFYEVEPSDVRKLKRKFEEAFAWHEHDSNAEMEEVQSWRSALTAATSLSAWDSRNYENHAVLIEEIVEDVYRKLIHISSSST